MGEGKKKRAEWEKIVKMGSIAKNWVTEDKEIMNVRKSIEFK